MGYLHYLKTLNTPSNPLNSLLHRLHFNGIPPYRFLFTNRSRVPSGKNQGCDIEIKSAFYIPPVEEIKTTKVAGETITFTKTLKPFYSIIKDIQKTKTKNVESM